MELYEQIVLAYLTKDPFRFVNPQYSVRTDKRESACPDFVALNFKTRVVEIVEVSTAWNPASLRTRVAECENRWVAKLRDQLTKLNVIDAGWTFEVSLFVRRNAAQAFPQQTGATPIKVTVLDDLGAPWNWQWDWSLSEPPVA